MNKVWANNELTDLGGEAQVITELAERVQGTVV